MNGHHGSPSRAALGALLLTLIIAPAHAGEPETVFAFGHAGSSTSVTRTVRIGAFDLYFKPKHMVVRQGQTVRFVITNYGTLTHEFVIGDAAEQQRHEREMRMMDHMGGMKMNRARDPNGVVVRPGETKTLIWTFGKPGSVEYACHEGQHFAAGMVGKIRVAGAPAHQAPAPSTSQAHQGKE